eukprot:GFYU01002442.1.p1 GENE.GFYU01002442.1~~GFYU01002442.1.p1  ORF type:complete len:422 (+),score=99.94 GFYU01002442.1:142-1407(+)
MANTPEQSLRSVSNSLQFPLSLFPLKLVQRVWLAFLVLILTVLNIFRLPRKLDQRTLCQIVTGEGYLFEHHQITTKDGYILTAFRILNSRGKVQPNRTPVLLMHGLFDCGFTWFVQGPNRGLPYILADAGYDVWVVNNRGTVYSQRHIYLDPSDPMFWQFSFDHMAMYDVPDSIDYILKQTKEAQLAYVGHSEGTTQFFAAMSSQPDLSEFVSCFVGLGPVATVGSVKNPFLRFMADFRVDIVFEMLGFKKGFMMPSKGALRHFLAGVLYMCPWLGDAIVGAICGKPHCKFRHTEAGIWVEHEPGGTSTMNIVHWAQAVRSGKRFQMYDYGPERNLVEYKTKNVPEYNLKAIPDSLPMYLFVGENDELVDPSDVDNLTSQLKSTAVKTQIVKGFNHCDYLWDPSCADRIYNSIVDFVSIHE